MPDQYQKVAQNGAKKLFFINVVGTTAAIISAISLLPQLFDVIQTNNVEGISISTLVLIFTTSSLWLAYHILMGTYHGSVSATFNLVFAGTLIVMVISIRNSEEGKDDERLPLTK